MKLRWGICGAGKISSDFCAALRTLPKDEHEIVAIASTSIERGQSYRDQFGIKKSYGSYAEISTDPEIDIVYIGVIHTGHVPLTKLMLNAGKHVLCEKPMCLNLQQARDMFQIAKEKNRFLMEAVWSRAFPIYKRIKDEISSGTLGDIQMVTATLAKLVLKPTFHDKATGGGTMMAFGMYPIQFANWVFNNEKPEKILATSSLSETGTDTDACIILSYKNGAKASLVCSSKCAAVNSGLICGTKGKIQIPDNFWCPTEAHFPFGKMITTLPDETTPYYFQNGSGLRFEADLVRKCIMEGKTECPVMSYADTEALFAIMDEVRRQTGLNFDADMWCDDSKWTT